MLKTTAIAKVATLIANPRAPCLDLDVITRARAALPSAEIAILKSGVAADLHFSHAGPVDALYAALRDALASFPIDIVIQPGAARRKKLLIADMDSTMIEQECIDELADMAGLKAHVSAITERAMRGEIDFEPALRERVALLKGVPASIVETLLNARITLMPGGMELVRTMRRDGAFTALVSGGFTLFTGPIATKIGFEMHRSNILVIDGTAFAGTVAEPILGREAKRATLLELRMQLGLSPDETLAVGDGANDLAMLAEAGLGVAYRAKPIVAEAAHARIDHADLTALLYLQGYRAEDFAA